MDYPDNFNNPTESPQVINSDQVEQSSDLQLPTYPTTAADEKAKKRRRRFSIGKFISVFLILISIFFMGFAGVTAYQLVNAGQSSLGVGQDQGFFEAFSDLGKAVNPFAQRAPLKGESEGRTNFLLLGQDAAAGLTDTIMIASYYHEEKAIATVNLPRDFYVYDGYGQHKINAVYPFADARFNRTNVTAGDFMSSFIEDEFGIDMHYWAVVDFQGVEDIVDTLDGITVDVERSFTDFNYPNESYGFLRPAPSFKAGEQELDGETALIYARSRKGNNGEGSDFARSTRQSKVVQGILEEVKDQGIVNNVSKFESYLQNVLDNVKTNMRASEIRSFAEIMRDVNVGESFYRITWATGNGILCDGSSNELYVIKYCGGAIAGRNTTSYGRTRGIATVQDLLQRAKLDQLFSAEVAIYGNASNSSTEFRQSLLEAGFEDVKINNVYRQITRATSTSVESVTVYIEDDTIRDLFNELDSEDIEPSFTVRSEIPETVVQPTGADAKIVVWVESI